jgi:hypothetical protein
MIHALQEVYVVKLNFLLAVDTDQDYSMSRVKFGTRIPDRINHANVVSRADLNFRLDKE